MLSIPQHVFALLGRILLAVIFLVSGVNYIFAWPTMVAALSNQLTVLTGTALAEHREALAPILLAGATAFLLGGGLMVLLGLGTRIGALLLIVFLIPTTILFHNFWVYDPSEPEYVQEMVNFLKNLSILGGLFLVLAFGSGWFGGDTFVRRKR